MTVWQGIFWVVGVAAAVALVWGGLGWFIEKVIMKGKYGDGYAIAGGILAAVAAVLFVGWIVASVVNMEPDEKGRCGPGTKMVVEQIWTGKVYVTDLVCVVDGPA